jgi:hypothetical protein
MERRVTEATAGVSELWGEGRPRCDTEKDVFSPLSVWAAPAPAHAKSGSRRLCSGGRSVVVAVVVAVVVVVFGACRRG